jgi:hypothetical protein
VIAALYVQRGGVYWGCPGVDPWDEARDARLYAGPWPVVAHPPCARWGRYWSGGPSAKTRRKLGDDGGCFAAALEAVRRWGGVLEHPEGSHAWRAFHIPCPPKSGGWVHCLDGGWTCCVEQGHYGHRARKATWLYAYGFAPPTLIWGPAASGVRLDGGYHSTAERQRAIKTGIAQRLSHRERAATPPAFRDLLLDMARIAGAPLMPAGGL